MSRAAFVAAAFAAACHVSIPAWAGPRDDLEAIAQAFEETALRVRDAEPAAVVKWSTPLRYVIHNNGAPPDMEQQARRAIAETAALARVAASEVTPADPAPNFVVRLENSAASSGQPCRAEMQSTNGRMTRVDVFMNVHRFRGVGHCITHEVMHGFGFRSHPRTADSILARGAARLDYTPTDKMLIRVLYDRRLGNNMETSAAARVACRVLAENLGISRWQAEPVCARRPGAAGGRLTRR